MPEFYLRRHIFKTVVCMIILMCSAVSYGQNLKQYLKYGDESMAEGDYYGASLYYAKAVAVDSSDLELLWKYAQSLRLYNEYEKAAYYYDKIYSVDKGRTILEAVFWLAMMQKYNGDYKASLKTWKFVAKRYKKEHKSYYYKKAKHEIKSCTWAIGQKGDSIPVAVNNLGSVVNTTNSEFAATDNEGNLYFSSLRAEHINDKNEVTDDEYAIRLYKTKNIDNAWTKPVLLDSVINKTTVHTANGSFSPDKKRFYYSQCNDEYGCNIYMSKIVAGNFTEPVKIGDGINGDEFTSTQPSVAKISGKEVLLFASDMKGTVGKLDLWWSEIKNEGENYSKPKNMSKVINSIDDDISPFYDSNDSTLYYSSEWFNNLGGFDVFMAKGYLNNFDYPVNVGYPINTSWNDFYFSKVPHSNKVYLTSNRKGSITAKGATCCNDLYEVVYPAGEITYDTIQTLEDLNKYLPVTLYFHNDRPNPRTRDTITNLNYITTYNTYTSLKQEYRTEYGKSKADKENAATQIDNFFDNYVDQGVSDLELFSELLMKELQKGQDIELTVKGFASPLAKTDYNVPLTLRRISSMINYLKEYQDGIYQPYINGTAENGGKLSFIKVPFGEYTADQTISDDRLNQEQSVYSPPAMSERRIQIVSVQLANRDSAFAEMTFDSEINDFGSVIKGVVLHHTFIIKNTGNLPLKIDSVIPECGCTVATFSTNDIASGETAELEITMDTSKRDGITAVHIIVLNNGKSPEKEISITAEIINE